MLMKICASPKCNRPFESHRNNLTCSPECRAERDLIHSIPKAGIRLRDAAARLGYGNKPYQDFSDFWERHGLIATVMKGGPGRYLQLADVIALEQETDFELVELTPEQQRAAEEEYDRKERKRRSMFKAWTKDRSGRWVRT